MFKIFLGKGWQFPVDVDAGGALAVAEYEESVRQSIWVVLGTAIDTDTVDGEVCFTHLLPSSSLGSQL